jgi:hypothetical protein
MATRPIKKATKESAASDESSYPSLRQHLAGRRRFLAMAGASVAATGLWAACSRGLGSGEPGPDAYVEPDADITIMGDIEEPHYYLLRVPVTGDISAYLADGGYCSFYVELATFTASTFDTLTQHMDEAQGRCREVLQDFTYDGLNTAAGVSSAEDDLIMGLDELVQELEGHANSTVEYATLTISYLEPYEQLDGGIGLPEYP